MESAGHCDRRTNSGPANRGKVGCGTPGAGRPADRRLAGCSRGADWRPSRFRGGWCERSRLPPQRRSHPHLRSEI